MRWDLRDHQDHASLLDPAQSWAHEEILEKRETRESLEREEPEDTQEMEVCLDSLDFQE